MIANYRFLGVDSDTLSTVYNINPKSAQQKSIIASRALSFLRLHTAALLPSKPVKAKKRTITGCFQRQKGPRASCTHIMLASCAAALLP